EALRDTAVWIGQEIEKIDGMRLISDGTAMPVIAFERTSDDGYTVFDVSHELRAMGWQVPAYTMPEDAEDVAVLRIVVREGFSRPLAAQLVGDLKSVCRRLEGGVQIKASKQHFAH